MTYTHDDVGAKTSFAPMIPTDYSALRALVVSAPLWSALNERPLDVRLVP